MWFSTFSALITESCRHAPYGTDLSDTESTQKEKYSVSKPISQTQLILNRMCVCCAMALIVLVGVLTREFVVPSTYYIRTINETMSTYNGTDSHFSQAI